MNSEKREPWASDRLEAMYQQYISSGALQANPMSRGAIGAYINALEHELRAALSTEAQPEVSGAVAWDAEAFARLDQMDSDKWVVHKPDDAPYAGIRTKDGRTIAGTSSGLSVEHAEEICANQHNREYIKVLLKKIVDLQRQQSPSAIEAAVREKLEEAAYKCENMADKIGDMNTYNNSCESCCDNSAMRMAYDCAEAIRALMESPHTSVEEPAN